MTPDRYRLLRTRGPSACLPRHVPEYSWHFGSRGRPYAIYSPAYRTFSAADTHDAPLSLSLSRRYCAISSAGATGKNSRGRFTERREKPRVRFSCGRRPSPSQRNFSEVRNCRPVIIPAAAFRTSPVLFARRNEIYGRR